MSTRAEKRRANAAAAKERRQKIIAFGGLGVLAALLVIQGPGCSISSRARDTPTAAPAPVAPVAPPPEEARLRDVGCIVQGKQRPIRSPAARWPTTILAAGESSRRRPGRTTPSSSSARRRAERPRRRRRIRRRRPRRAAPEADRDRHADAERCRPSEAGSSSSPRSRRGSAALRGARSRRACGSTASRRLGARLLDAEAAPLGLLRRLHRAVRDARRRFSAPQRMCTPSAIRTAYVREILRY